MSKGKVVVGMSGGVDSSVAAALLQKQGYDVIGATMQIWQDEPEMQPEEGSCCGVSAVEDARAVAARLGIPYYVMNFKEEFQTRVIDYFISEYLKGHTPNPCIACNRYVKWESLLTRSRQIGADYIATGHYAQIVQLTNGRYTLKQAVQTGKDQTYALYGLTQEQLAHTLLPVGAYPKTEIRQMARDLKLPVAEKPDSQDICFVPDGDYAGYICSHTEADIRPGNFVTTDGTVVGQHKGIIHYTVGQRKGLGLALNVPVYVKEIRSDTNEVVVGTEEEVKTREVRADHLQFMGLADLPEERRFWGKIRYNHKGAACSVRRTGDDEILCTFDEPVKAVTPGQAVVLYEDGCIMLGGTITGGGET